MSFQVVVPTCDRYASLMTGFFHQWSKYYGLPGMVVCEQTVPKLPAGWSFFRAGHDAPGKMWTGNLKLALEQVYDDVILLVLDDYWLTKPADKTGISQIVASMERDKSIDKIDLTNDRMGFAHVEWDANFVRSTPLAAYLTSTQAALWNTSYLRSCLADPDWTPWEFEILGTQKAQQMPHKILGSRVPRIHYANVMLKAKPNEKELLKISSEDSRLLGGIGAYRGLEIT